MLLSAAWGFGFAALAQEPAGGTTFRKADLDRMTTTELAVALLPPDRAQVVQSHKLVSGIVHGGNYSAVEFLSAPRRLTKNFCARSRYYVSLRPAAGLNEAPQRADAPARMVDMRVSEQIALASDCAAAPNYAHVNSGDLISAMELLEYLTKLRAAARNTSALPIKVDCATDLEDDSCRAGATARLANLPLEQAFIIDRPGRLEGRKWKWRVSIPEVVGSFGPYAEVNLDEGPACASRIEIRRKIPAPF